MLKPFNNPYIGVDKANKYALQLDIDSQDMQQLKLTRPRHGTIAVACSIVIKELINQLKERNLTDVTKSTEFEQFIAGSRLISESEYARLVERGLLDGTVSRPMSHAGPPYDGGRTAEPHHPDSTDASVVPNLQVGGSTSGKRKGKTTGKG